MELKETVNKPKKFELSVFGVLFYILSLLIIAILTTFLCIAIDNNKTLKYELKEMAKNELVSTLDVYDKADYIDVLSIDFTDNDNRVYVLYTYYNELKYTIYELQEYVDSEYAMHYVVVETISYNY